MTQGRRRGPMGIRNDLPAPRLRVPTCKTRDAGLYETTWAPRRADPPAPRQEA